MKLTLGSARVRFTNVKTQYLGDSQLISKNFIQPFIIPSQNQIEMYLLQGNLKTQFLSGAKQHWLEGVDGPLYPLAMSFETLLVDLKSNSALLYYKGHNF